MLPKSALKDVIVSNERFVLESAGRIVVREGLQAPGELRKTVVFYGVRRSGKTFILFDLFRRHAGAALYVDFEDDRLSGFGIEDFDRLLEAFLELKPGLAGRRCVLLLDEVQRAPGWERFCRRVVERGKARAFVSGSSYEVTPARLRAELRGRAWGVEVLPFSFREYLAARGGDPDDEGCLHGPGKAAVKARFAEFLAWGGFPEAALLSSEAERTKLLKEYMGALFFRDLAERYSISNIALLEALSEKLFSSFAQKVSLTAVYRQYKDKLPLSKDLLFRYYGHFLHSMLVHEVRKWTESVYERRRNPAKVYLADAGLARRSASADRGRLLENAVYLELRRRGWEPGYFEGERECDFMACASGGPPFPVQVAFELHEANKDREVGGLIEACRRAGSKRGFILTFDDEDGFLADGIAVTVSPAWKWMLRPRSAEFGPGSG